MTHRSRDGSRNNPFGDEEMGRRSRSPSLYDDDDDDSLSGHSFGGDEDFYDEGIKSSNPPPRVEQIRRPRISRTKSRDVLGASTHSNGASTTVTGITGVTGGRIRLPGEIKQNKLLRRRRILRENKKAESKELHYHFIGSVLNTSLAVIAMIFIITIASTVSPTCVLKSLHVTSLPFFLTLLFLFFRVVFALKATMPKFFPSNNLKYAT